MIGLLITARLKSTRLPRKALLPLAGKPMLERMIERLKHCDRLDLLAVCTSPLAEDDALADLADAANVRCFRGDPVDVLGRIRDAAHEFDLQTVVSATADNPLVDPYWARRLIDHHLAAGADYGRIEGLPFGTFCYTLDRDAIDLACRIKDEEDTEVWGGYFARPDMFNSVVLDVDDASVRHPEYRLTVDTPEDYELMNSIFDALHSENRLFTLGEVIAYLEENPDVAAVNADVRQATPREVRLKPEFQR